MENSLGVTHIQDANILTQNKIIYNTIIDILNTINKKGIAQVTIKKSVIKKLKAGKKYPVKVSYIKDAVKASVIVKK